MKHVQLIPWLCAVMTLAFAGLDAAAAQSGSSDEAMRLIASRSVGMPDSTFEISSTDAVLKILRVNSTMNSSTHQGRNNEAGAIVAAVLEELVRRGPQNSNIVSISVNYIERTDLSSGDRLIDRIDFRKNAAGKFELHIS